MCLKRQSEHIPALKLLVCCLATFRSCTRDSGDNGDERGSLSVRQLFAARLNQDSVHFQSVRVHMAGVAPLLLCLAIQPQEVFVARSTTHPGLPKPHSPSKEEVPLPGLHLTPQGHLDVASPAPYPHPPRRKDLDLLSVKTTDLHCNRRVLVFLVHFPNAAPCHWKNKI